MVESSGEYWVLEVIEATEDCFVLKQLFFKELGSLLSAGADRPT